MSVQSYRFAPEVADFNRVCRVPRKPRGKSSAESEQAASSLPEELQQPLAVAVRLLAPKPETPTLDDSEFPDPKSPGAVTPADEDGPRSPAMGSKAGVTSLVRRAVLNVL